MEAVFQTGIHRKKSVRFRLYPEGKPQNNTEKNLQVPLNTENTETEGKRTDPG
jgi:hypothetical protein